MTDLIAIIRATRRSAAALKRMQRALHGLQYATEWKTIQKLSRMHLRAERDYEAAQYELAANPLPGDRV